MNENRSDAAAATKTELETIVAEADTGARSPAGIARGIIFSAAVAWSLFQLWYASPLPFAFRFGIFNDTEARAIHLSFALVLAFTAYPASKRSPRDSVPWLDWGLALAAIASVLYLVVFYWDLAQRPGLPTRADILVAVLGIVLLLEASRRSEGPWMPALGILLLAYVFAGPWLPGLLAHRGASLGRAASHFWLTSEGVFGVALGVSTQFIFLFVLFGALLDKAGAGAYFIRTAFAIMGRFRGGPAKAGVVSSGLTGMISGSSVANVVTTGTFTIPLMKRVGYTPVQAAAIECAAGVNGQLMPPVMGAAAFLMAEYVGISYAEVCKHALLPALITYGALFYLVDIEAVKRGMTGLPVARRRPLAEAALRAVLTLAGFVVFAGLVYWGLGWTKTVLGAAATWLIAATLALLYLVLLWDRARRPEPVMDDAKALSVVPDFWDTVQEGLHYFIPVGVLVWCLMVEEMSPGLAAFWGVAAMAFLLLTQRPLLAVLRGERRLAAPAWTGARELIAGLETGARNMAAVGIATATAGILVGTVTLTGIGLVMTEIVEFLSAGNIVLMLLLTALICIVLGTGLPTTASYVVVATLMAPVVVDLAAQNGLAVPLIAVHMFVFYFGLMADVSPPVGLAAYAAGAIAGADPIKAGWQASIYESRTALLPLIFVFNPEILMIDIGGLGQFALVVASACLAMMCFVAASQRFFLARNRLWETAALLLVCFTLFRPAFWLDRLVPPLAERPAADVVRIAEATPVGRSLTLKVASDTRAGEPAEKLVRLVLRAGGSGTERLAAAGLVLADAGDGVTVRSARLGSESAKFGLKPGDEVKAVLVPSERPSPHWFMIPALALLGAIAALQRRRRVAAGAGKVTPSPKK